MGGVSLVFFASIIVTAFTISGLHRIALRSPNVAAVVSATLIDLANQDRAQNGLSALTLDPLLVAAAQAKANDMAANSYFAHVSPQGVDPWHWFEVVGYKFVYAGENLAVDFSDSTDVNTAWMNSPTHRENILDPHYTQIGIATAQGMYQGHPTTFVVQEFGSPASAAAPVVAQDIPVTPTVPAVATTRPAQQETQVLGTSVSQRPVAIAPQQASKQAPVVEATATTDPVVAAVLTEDAAQHMPWWASIVSFPRDSLRIMYYIVTILVLFGLAVDTGFEFTWHHRRRALHAGALLVTMSVLFVIANLWFFAPPVLAAGLAAL